MSLEKAKAHLASFGAAERILQFPVSSATVELAAAALGCAPARIAKTLSFHSDGGGCILLVAAGDAKVHNAAFKAQFGCKAKMLAADEVKPVVGHAIGGVCPFGINPGVAVYLDRSLLRFQTVFPACGTSSSAIELTTDELLRFSGASDWVDVCKGWQESEDAQ